ncbi:MAG: FAD-binding domain-containing protein [Bacteroidota bacterium]|jgi:deoxyribodipyrimidine photo-lyase
MRPGFPTNYASILERINQIDPVAYGKSRNYLNGAVTYLSPYISRGVISTRQILDAVLAKGYKVREIESFVKELCWRDYFQRVGQYKDLNVDIRFPQTDVASHGIPTALLQGQTGVVAVDQSIQVLYETGYMHNHARMYTASIVCNVAKSYWKNPSQWMYYHLLDGDWASNTCSWQWVAAANSSKKYFANQENINKFAGTNQRGTFLDKSYEELATMDVPNVLFGSETFQLNSSLPQIAEIEVNTKLPTYVYNYYNLDPLWHKYEVGNRILLLEPAIFKQFPVSEKCIDFVLALSHNIPNVQVYAGSFQSLINHCGKSQMHFKEHPLNRHYKGVEEPRDWIASEVDGYFPSFFGYWKKVEKCLR